LLDYIISLRQLTKAFSTMNVWVHDWPQILAGLSLIMGERWELPQETSTWIAVGWLSIIGSVGLFTLDLPP
jgi:hypothetical protein